MRSRSKKISIDLRVSRKKGSGSHTGTSKHVEYVLIHISRWIQPIWLTPAEAKKLAEYIHRGT